MIGNSALKAFGGLAATVGVAGAGLGIVKLPPHATVPTTPPPAVSAPAPSGAAPSQGPIVIQTPAPAAPAPGPAPQTKVIEHSAPIIVSAPPASPGGDVSSTNGPAINLNVATNNNNVQEQASTQEQDQTSSQAQTDTQTQTAPAPGPAPVVVKPKSPADPGRIKIEAGVKVGPVVAKPAPKQLGGVGDVLKDINKALPCDPIRAIAGLC